MKQRKSGLGVLCFFPPRFFHVLSLYSMQMAYLYRSCKMCTFLASSMANHPRPLEPRYSASLAFQSAVKALPPFAVRVQGVYIAETNMCKLLLPLRCMSKKAVSNTTSNVAIN